MPSEEVRVETSADMDTAARLSVLAMDLACQADPTEIASRVTELAAKLVPCAAVDIAEISSAGELKILASSDRALTKILGQSSGARLFELQVANVSYGYLRFLFRDDDSLSATDEELAAAFATHAAIALDRVALMMKVANLQTAIDTNREIGAAVGILMGRHVIGYPEAFRLLLGISQNDNRKLRDVAAEVVLTGALPIQRFGRAQHCAAPVKQQQG